MIRTSRSFRRAKSALRFLGGLAILGIVAPSESPAGFLGRAVDWFARRGVVAKRVLSNNGSGYRSRVANPRFHVLYADEAERLWRALGRVAR